MVGKIKDEKKKLKKIIICYISNIGINSGSLGTGNTSSLSDGSNTNTMVKVVFLHQVIA